MTLYHCDAEPNDNYVISVLYRLFEAVVSRSVGAIAV